MGSTNSSVAAQSQANVNAMEWSGLGSPIATKRRKYGASDDETFNVDVFDDLCRRFVSESTAAGLETSIQV